MDCKRTPGLISVGVGRPPAGFDAYLPARHRTTAAADASVVPITDSRERRWVGVKRLLVNHLVSLSIHGTSDMKGGGEQRWVASLLQPYSS